MNPYIPDANKGKDLIQLFIKMLLQGMEEKVKNINDFANKIVLEEGNYRFKVNDKYLSVNDSDNSVLLSENKDNYSLFSIEKLPENQEFTSDAPLRVVKNVETGKYLKLEGLFDTIKTCVDDNYDVSDPNCDKDTLKYSVSDTIDFSSEYIYDYAFFVLKALYFANPDSEEKDSKIIFFSTPYSKVNKVPFTDKTMTVFKTPMMKHKTFGGNIEPTFFGAGDILFLKMNKSVWFDIEREEGFTNFTPKNISILYIILAILALFLIYYLIKSKKLKL